MNRREILKAAAVAAPAAAMGGGLTTPDAAAAPVADRGGPLTIREQGGFAVGGTVVTRRGTFDPRNPTNPAGQTLHGDHARVFYQVPTGARALPLVLWHGFKEAGTCWGMTPDGREGFQTFFLRRRYPVYTLD